MDATATRPQPPAPPADTAREVVLRTEGLTKHYGRRAAVNHLGLEVRRGDVFGLLGPNGSGKTTTLRMVLGLVWPTAGQVFLFGQSTMNGDHRRAALKRIGAIAEQPAFYPFLSGRDNLFGVATFSGLPANDATRARVREVLEQVGLGPRAGDAYKKYSLGMKQRLGIAATLLTNPELIVLDEPTNGLDPAGMVEVRALIGQLAQSGVTVLLSSHLLHEVQQVCTRVAILKEGTLLAQGEVANLLSGSSGIVLGFATAEQAPQAAGLLLGAAAGEAPWLRSVQYVPPEPGAWTPPGGWLLRVDAPAEHAADVNRLLAAQGIYAAEVRRAEGNLEQYFLALTGAPAVPQPQAPAAPSTQPQGGPA
ncbi:MAG TPA: ATP-binding cassette domain-containing protein [Ktedonobacterales bacterium]|nr:ATP-binding cassette domain-containing protein [Ktedonobacterales bacterium]